MRVANEHQVFNDDVLTTFGIEKRTLVSSVNHVYNLFDSVDTTLIANGGVPLGELVELANLSAIVGNVFRSGLIKHSSGLFVENLPHTFPDLLSTKQGVPSLEIKVCLEQNNPKGHLVKPGPHMILRYVLAQKNGQYKLGKENRGVVPYFWEIKLGFLTESHFNVSNTVGDSGKTAVINKDGLENLSTVFFDKRMFPYSRVGSTFKRYSGLFSS
tara:strand:- start:1745 stop:2386 length:642 start_codon:yes stop_codon:yes gene_type:complete